MNFLIYLSGVFEFLGIAGGVGFWILFFWFGLSKYGRLILKNMTFFPEHRCRSCIYAEDCIVAESGIRYPCPYYEDDKR